MPLTPDAPITDLLARAHAGEPEAQDAAARLVYDELHGLAKIYLGREHADATLEPTALVNEAYLRLLGQQSGWKNRSHFFGIAAQAMRRILVDRARHRSAARRDRAMVITLDEQNGGPTDMVADVLGVHEALDRLALLDARQARVVELKFFVGLSLEEIGAVLEISPATVSREWAMARVWLEQELTP